MAVLDRQRFDVRMPKELADQLDSISERTGFTRAEIFRRAIALYKEAKEVEGRNGDVLFRDENNQITKIINL